MSRGFEGRASARPSRRTPGASGAGPEWESSDATYYAKLDGAASNGRRIVIHQRMPYEDVRIRIVYRNVRAWNFADFPQPERRRHIVRLWLKAYGTRHCVNQDLFRDYDGVGKTLDRLPATAGAA